MDWWIGTATAAMKAFLWSSKVNKGLSRKMKLLIYVPALTWVHEVWITIERTRLWNKRLKLTSLEGSQGLAWDIMCSFTWGELKEPLLLHTEESQQRWFRHLNKMLLGYLSCWFSRHCPLWKKILQFQRPLKCGNYKGRATYSEGKTGQMVYAWCVLMLK